MIEIKIVCVSNYFNHHQLPLSQALYELPDTEYTFIAVEAIDEERTNLGWTNETVPGYVRSYAEEKDLCDALIRESDVLILGSAPNALTKLKRGKSGILFKYSERVFKEDQPLIKRLWWALSWHLYFDRYTKARLLCASGFAAADYASLGLFKNRAYRWGYFPPTELLDTEKTLAEKEKNSILWCGRYIEWKHAEHTLLAADKLREQGLDFRLTLVGTGPMEDRLRAAAKELLPDGCVRFLPAMPPEKVREQMKRSAVYLITSDRQEGWGAVLNESMNSMCAVVASDAIGSAPYLIRNGINALTYPFGDIDRLSGLIAGLLKDPDEQARLGLNAYQTITEQWNGAVAAKRLKALVDRINAGEDRPKLFDSGPCADA